MKKIMQRTLAVLLVLVIFSTVAPVAGLAEWLGGMTASAETHSGTCGDDLTWTLDTDTGVLTVSGTGEMRDYSWRKEKAPWNEFDHLIQTAIIADGVTRIGENAFYACKKLTSVTLPNSLIEIGDGAFERCESLTGITFPNGLTEIGSWAFECCESLTRITIPNSVTYVGHGAFESCIGLMRVTLSNRMTYISDSMFYDCESLASITIPNGVTQIGSEAFVCCESLMRLSIPSSVTYIGENAFYMVGTVIYNGSASGSPWGALSVNGFADGDFIYKNAAKTVLVRCNPAVAGTVTVPNSVTRIDDLAFYNCTNLVRVTVPNSVTSIGENAFYRVGTVFYNGSASGSPWSALSVNGFLDGDLVYTDSTKTELVRCSTAATGAVTLPDSVTYIGKDAFYACRKLTSVTLPDSVTEIDDGVFSDCDSLASVTIPNSVSKIGENTFYNCKSLTSIVLPDSVSYIKWYGFAGCTNLTDITIPDSVEEIGNWAFENCTSLTNITIPNGVKYIGTYAFSGCTSLTSVEIPDSVTRIEDCTFENCKSLKNITIPQTITCIEAEAFEYCYALTDVYFSGSRAQWNKIKIDSENDFLFHAAIHFAFDPCADGHSYTVTEMCEPTCTTKGETVYICDVCGETDTQIIPATGHTPVTDAAVAPTCTETGLTEGAHCDICGEILTKQYTVPKTDHIPGEWVINGAVCRRRCTVCDTLIEEKTITLTLDQSSLLLPYKGSALLGATSTAPDDICTVRFTSSNEKVAKVDENGNITAIGKGTAIITVTVDGTTVQQTCTVTVKYTLLQWIICIFLFGFLWY